MLAQLGQAHVDSFDDFVSHGIGMCSGEMSTAYFSGTFSADGAGLAGSISLERLWLDRPNFCRDNFGSTKEKPMYPSHARIARVSYGGILRGVAKISFESRSFTREVDLGLIPVTVGSCACNTHGMSAKERVRVGEEADDVTGYSIVNGQEVIMRMLQAPRRNTPFAIDRAGWASRGHGFTSKGVMVRSVCPRLPTGVTNVLHAVRTGNAVIALSIHKRQLLLPLGLVLKSFRDTTDKEIMSRLLAGDEGNASLRSIATIVLTSKAASTNLHSRADCLKLMGRMIKPMWQAIPGVR